MTDAELVKKLRNRRVCLQTGLNLDNDYPLLREAADAIEELARKEKFHTFLWNTIQPNEMEQYLAMYHAGDGKEET